MGYVIGDRGKGVPANDYNVIKGGEGGGSAQMNTVYQDSGGSTQGI